MDPIRGGWRSRLGSLLSVSPAVSGPINTVLGKLLGHPALRRPAGGNGAHAMPGLTTDNVDANDATFSPTFPYLAPGN